MAYDTPPLRGLAPHPHHEISSHLPRGRDLACLYESRLTTSPRPRHACAPFHRSRLDATTHIPRDRPRARAVVGDATTSPRRHTRARVSYGPQTTRASDVRTEYTRTRALFTSTADARPIAR